MLFRSRRPGGRRQARPAAGRAPRRLTPSGARRVGARRPAGPAARAIPPHAPPRRAERHAKLAKNDDLTTSDRRKTAAFLCEHGDHRARPGEMKRRWRRCEPTGCGFVVRSSFLASFSAIPASTAATKPRTAPFPPVDAGPKAKTHPGRPCREDVSRPGTAPPWTPEARGRPRRQARRPAQPTSRAEPARTPPHPAHPPPSRTPRHRRDAPAPRPLPRRKGAPGRGARGALSLLSGRA